MDKWKYILMTSISRIPGISKPKHIPRAIIYLLKLKIVRTGIEAQDYPPQLPLKVAFQLGCTPKRWSPHEQLGIGSASVKQLQVQANKIIHLKKKVQNLAMVLSTKPYRWTFHSWITKVNLHLVVTFKESPWEIIWSQNHAHMDRSTRWPVSCFSSITSL